MRFPRQLCLPTGAALGVLTVSLACGGGGSSASSGSTPTAPVAIVATDAPSDQWAHVWVHVTRITLVKAGGGTEVVAFDDPTHGEAGKIDLVNLDSVGELLASAQVPEGTYTRAVVTVSEDPASVTLIAQGGGPVTVSKVVGGAIPVDLSPALVVSQGHGGAVQVDFDLSHPLFVVMLPDGSAVLNLQVRHKPNPADLRRLQLRAHAGQVTSVSAAAFDLITLHGAHLAIGTDGGTLFRNIDTHSAGSLTEMGTLAAAGHLYALATTGLDGVGSFYAARVYYSTDAAAVARLLAWMREGHVLAVDSDAATLTLNDPASATPQTVAIDADTTFTFQGADTVVGVGAAGLAEVAPGFKVHITLKDPAATPAHAATVNIQRAVDEGFVATADLSSFTLGTAHPRTYAYTTGFNWWEQGQPAATSTDLAAWAATVGQQSQGIAARVVSGLAWNASGGRWDAGHGILVPYHLPLATLATSYDGASGTMQVSYVDPLTTATTTKTVTVTTGTGGTLLAKAENQSGVFTVGSATTADLTSGARAWVRVVPQAGGLKARSVVLLP